MPGFGLLPQPV